MGEPYHASFVDRELALRRRRWRPLLVLVGLLLLLTLLLLLWGAVAGFGLLRSATPVLDDIETHFKYGSIGSERESGIPYAVWQALPRLFPEAFEGRDDYGAFGFLYERDGEERRDLPIGISRRTWRGVDLVWFNCAVCHAGTWRLGADDERHIVVGMPSNNLDLYGFIRFLLEAGADERLAPDHLLEAIEETGGELGWTERLIWKLLVIPKLREGLILRRSRVLPLLELQPAWGPGRVDTFNPYKVLVKRDAAADLSEAERIGASDFPSIFLQGPRGGMQLHWDGNNDSLAERNLSAALGAGVTPETVDHAAIERVADWLLELRPPPSPYRPDPEAVARGRRVYQEEGCAACHGEQAEDGYRFAGAHLGKVALLDSVESDPARLNSYTEAFRDWQLATLFAGTPYQFTRFRKTDGYANQPLDGLWLRAPYLHNGSVPTLADLLESPSERPGAFLRGDDRLDPERGGFRTRGCAPGEALEGGFCFDTLLDGNHNTGHLWGTRLEAGRKADLLAYLLTF